MLYANKFVILWSVDYCVKVVELHVMQLTAQVTGGRKYLPQGPVAARGQHVGSPALDVVS